MSLRANAATPAEVVPGTPPDARIAPAARPEVDRVEVLDGADELDELLCLSVQLLGCRIALVSVHDGEGQRVVAERGLGAGGQDSALLRGAGYDTPVLLVFDAAADARFRDDPLVREGVRFYAGFALFGPGGRMLGTLAVADPRPRAHLAPEALATLGRLGRVAARLLDRRALERKCRIAEQVAQADSSALIVFDASNEVTFANFSAQAAFGPAVAPGQSMQSLFPDELQPHPDAAAHWLASGHAGTEGASAAACELHVRDAAGEVRVVEAMRCTWLSGDDHGTALILRDASDPARPQRQQVLQDPLTGLANRDGLLAILAAMRSRGEPVGVALLGLDNFRAVNDTLGHSIGDTVLQVVASRLLAWLPAEACLARFGGDEFALAFPAAQAGSIEPQLHSMLRSLARPCEVDYQRVHIEACIGIAVEDAGDTTADAREGAPGARRASNELLARAGLAMQHAKRAGTGHVRRFSHDMRTEAIERRKLDLELRRAFRQGEFELHYQPQVDLASGCPTGAEALLRWRHPERGLLMPVAFIDALAQSALAPAVGRWILQRACMDAASWPRIAGRQLKVGVNLFPAQFNDEGLLDDVEHALGMSRLPAAQLELELTETIALRDDGVAERTLVRLRSRGMRVSYDDFGTGHASLSMLHRLPVNRVKIDRSFVRDAMTNRGDEAIVRSIALIARNFDMQVIAEGVETSCQAELLRDLGCQEVQGFLYSRALAPADFASWLDAHAGSGAGPYPTP